MSRLKTEAELLRFIRDLGAFVESAREEDSAADPEAVRRAKERLVSLSGSCAGYGSRGGPRKGGTSFLAVQLRRVNERQMWAHRVVGGRGEAQKTKDGERRALTE